MSFKLSNVLGVPFRAFVTDQLKTRATKSTTGGSLGTLRSTSEVLFLANQMAWTRLCSSVQVDANYLKFLKEKAFEDDPDAFLANWNSTGLAENWVLQAGTSIYDGKGINLRSGIGYDGEYGLGGIKEQGYRPMPGITSVNVESAGRLGSLRYATIHFKVWNMNQLDIMDALYFRLGYTMLLEWGHVQYFETRNSTELTTDSNANNNLISTFFKKEVTKEEIQYQINKRIIESRGNYDAMLGVVCNFEYSFNQEGGWDCMIKLIGLGSIMESQKINISYVMPPDLTNIWKRNLEALRKRETERRQADIDRINNDAIAAATKTYESASADFEMKHPIKDSKTLYQNDISPQASNTDFTDGTWEAGLITRVAVTPDPYASPFTNQNYARLAIYYPTQDTLKTSWPTTQAFFDKSKTVLYFGNFPGGSLHGNINGYRPPIEVMGSINLRLDIVESYRSNAVEPGILLGTVTSAINRTTIQPMLDSSNTLNKLIGNIVAKIDKAGLPTTQDELVKVLNTPDTNLGYDYSLVNNATAQHAYIYQQAYYFEKNVSKPKGDYFTKSDNAHALSAYVFDIKGLSSVDIVNSYDVINALGDAINSDPKLNVSWSVDLIQEFKPGVSALGGLIDLSKLVGKIGTYPSAFLTLAKFFTVQPGKIPVYKTTTDAATKTNASSNKNPVKITVRLKTDLLGVIDNYYPPPISQYSPPTYQAPTKITASGALSIDATNKAIGLESSLEALLNLIKYTTIVETDKPNLTEVTSYNLTSITDRFLNTGTGSLPPLATIFTRTDGVSTVSTSSIESSIANDPVAAMRDPVALGIKGYSTTLMSLYNYKSNVDKTVLVSEKDCFQNTPTVDFPNMFKSVLVPKYVLNQAYDELTGYNEHPVYISLGYLLFILNSQCLLYDTTKGSGVTGNAEIARPIIYIDFNPKTNICGRIPSQLSIDPKVCLIPYEGSADDFKKLFLNGVLPSADTPLYQPTTADVSNALTSQDKGINFGFQGDSLYQGNTMNILLNIDYLLDVIKSTVDRDDHNNVYLQPFLERIVADVNKSLGDVNAFRVAYSDSSNTVFIQDDQFVPHLQAETPNLQVATKNEYEPDVDPDGLIAIPVFEEQSLARNFTFQTDTSTKMSRAIAIGAQAQNSGAAQSVDSSTYYWLNKGLTDRIITNKQNASTPSNSTTKTQPTGSEDPNVLLATKFNTHVKNIYDLSMADSVTLNYPNIVGEMIDPSRNFLIQSATKVKADTSGSTGALVIPLNTTLTISGISGIMMGNAFLLPDKVLPISLRGTDTQTKFGFYVMGLNHDIENNQWVTNIKGQIVRIRSDKSSFAARHEAEKAPAQAPLPTATPTATPTKVGNVDDKLRILYNKLKPIGLNKAAVAGVAGGLLAESGLNYQAWNIGETLLTGTNKTNIYYGSSKGDKLTSFNPPERPKFTLPTGTTRAVTAYGIAQWTRDRQRNYALFIDPRTGRKDSYESQIDFLIQELTSGAYKNCYNRLKTVSETSDGASQAALYWLDYYEFLNPSKSLSDSKERSKRASLGLGAWEVIKNF